MNTVFPGSARKIHLIAMVVALGMTAYHLLSTQILFVDYTEHQSIHLALALFLVFLNTARTSKARWYFIAALAAVHLKWRKE